MKDRNSERKSSKYYDSRNSGRRFDRDLSERRKRQFYPHVDRTYIAFYKPYAVLNQFTADGSDKETLAKFGFPRDVYPVGRLDYDSEGLLILSNDGRLTTSLFDQDNPHPRAYLVQIEKEPDEATLRKLEEGLMIDGRRTKPAEAYMIEGEPELPPRSKPIRFRKTVPTCWIELVLWEGRNRQVRKMTAAVGHPTLRLARVEIGSLSLFDLKLAPGEWRQLTEEEVLKLFA